MIKNRKIIDLDNYLEDIAFSDKLSNKYKSLLSTLHIRDIYNIRLVI